MNIFRKYILIIYTLIIFTAWLCWLFADEIASVVQFIWSIDPDLREKIKDFIQIIAGIAGVGSFIIAVLKIRSNTNPIIDSRTLLESYYHDLYKNCENINLSLVDSKFSEYAIDIQNTITLPKVYHEMDILSCYQEKSNNDDNKKHYKEAIRIPLLDAVNNEENKYILIIGDPGSGKSMFMDNLAWSIARSHIGEDDKNLPIKFKRSPIILIRLRSVALRAKQNGYTSNLLIESMEQELCSLLGENKGKQIWQTLKPDLLNRGVILLDGLDEVPETNNIRKNILKSINSLTNKLGHEAQLIITSRPYLLETEQASWLKFFKCFEIQPMSNEQIEELIKNWYILLRHNRRRTETVALKHARKLFIDLLERNYLLEPARRPLILTLLISLHYSYEVLPHSRAELYRQAIDLMLERWTQRAYSENKDYPLDDYEQKALSESEFTRKTALQKIAMDAHINKTLQIQDLRIKGIFSDLLPSHCNANNLLDFIRYRSGILKPGKKNNFEFYHRSFQDYLTALEITEINDWQDEIDRLLRTEGNEWWKEVFLLLISAKIYGNSKPDAISLLLRYVPDSINYSTYPEHEWSYLFLAAEATIEQIKPLQGYSNDQYTRLQKNLVSHLCHLVQEEHHLSPTLRAEAGKLLGKLGDPREGVTFIKNHDGSPYIIKECRVPDIKWEDISPGTLHMGSTDKEAFNDERPTHDLNINQFFISRYLITNAQYSCFIDAGGYQEEYYWTDTKESLRWLHGKKINLVSFEDDPQLRSQYNNWLSTDNQRHQPWLWEQSKWSNPNHPVVGISWYEALAFCKWINHMGFFEGKLVRLPTEEELEYASKGTGDLKFSWGSNPDPTLGNYLDTGIKMTSCVGLFNKGIAHKNSELYDTTGNVWEWTSTQWGQSIKEPDYTYDKWHEQSNYRNQLDSNSLKVIRGGAWSFSSNEIRCTVRNKIHPINRNYITGFRVVADIC